MPEIINLLKCFSCTHGLDSVALVLVLVQHVRVIVCMCVCVREGEGVGCAWVCLTFNILTSYFKNVKLCKHVALAVCLPPPPFPACPAPAAVRVTRVTIHLSPGPDDSAFRMLVPLTTSLSKCQRSGKKNNNKSLHTQTHTYRDTDITYVYVYFAEHFAGNSTTLARPLTWAANASA